MATGNATLESAASVDPKLAMLIGASVRLRVEDAAGHAYGTGTLIDAREGEALVITCGHLFRESKGKGTLTVELFEATPRGPRSVGQVPGLVISYDLERDVALVAIRPGRPVPVVPVAPPRTTIERGDRVASVGCSNGQDPTLLASRVTSIDRYQGPPNIEATGAPVEGRSGGGLFNEQGQLIGVCFAADHEANEGLYAALQAIHDELSARGLSDVYTRSAVGSLAANAPAAGPVIRGQEPGTVVMPPPGRESTPANDLFPAPAPAAVAVNTSNAGPAPIALANPVEQAAWDEIMNRAATSEVICIIRPKQPGGQSEVITLDGMSPEFVRALASLRKAPANITR
jgi:S1-C subfamily serine protease